ncbi:MAG: hypothetical protein ABIH85_07625 [Candidatus Omnitrophota bacterium]|nr:hypothetical protein [Candidatus Omnitrophota bacterium]
MPYNSKLDETLFSKSWENGDDRLTVSVHSYNKGTKKLQLARESKNAQGELRFAKLGRMTKLETEAVLPLIQEAMQFMD